MKSNELMERVAGFEFVDFVGPASSEVIEAASNQLGVLFPPQYYEFLSSFGCGGVDSEEFVGLGGPEHLDIVKLTARLRSRHNPLPSNLLPLRGDGYGNYDCLDLNQVMPTGELAIVQWLHDGGKNQHLVVLADSFDHWFETILEMMEANS